MSYWWVNLGETYKYEVKGFMWSPQLGARGPVPAYENMKKIAPGDVIFAFADTYIKAIGIAVTPAQASPKPDFGQKGTYWDNEGWLVEVQFTELARPVRIREYMELIRPTLPEKYSPLQANGNANQAYLFGVPDEMAKALAVVIGSEFSVITSSPVNLNPDELEFDSVEASLRMRMEISETEKLQLVKSRRGQGLFKANVRLVESACRVTGVNQISMLRASHVKPWSVSDDHEKIDGFNGLLLAPHVDHLFDKGYITFESKGEMVISPNLAVEILKKWSIPEILNVGSFSSEQSEYLNYHQENVFAGVA
jgi:hypothetical protein